MRQSVVGHTVNQFLCSVGCCASECDLLPHCMAGCPCLWHTDAEPNGGLYTLTLKALRVEGSFTIGTTREVPQRRSVGDVACSVMVTTCTRLVSTDKR